MGLIINTDDKGIRIWRNDKGQYPSYSYSISRKKQDGGYENCYKSVKFKKDVSVENGTDIIIDHAFESFDTGSDGRKYPYLMISEFHELRNENEIEIPDVDGAIPFD